MSVGLLNMLNKHAFLKEKAIDNLLDAKQHSDKRQYKYKHQILALMLSKNPKDFYIDSDQGSIVGITHAPTNFKIHIPKKFVPSKIENRSMPSTSQKQQKLMNWVHAIQKGKATGPAKIKHIAKSMSPESVDHFTSHGPIDKTLPVKKAFELGFLTRAKEAGVPLHKAINLFKLAEGPPPAPFAEPSLYDGATKPKPQEGIDFNRPVAPNLPKPDENKALNTPPGTPQPLPPSPLGIPQAAPPGQLPPGLGERQFKSAPGTREHAHELYLNYGDDSEIRSWAQAHPSEATVAARNSQTAWNNVGDLAAKTTNSLNDIQSSGKALDQHLNGINPMLYGSSTYGSVEGQNYNNAWNTYQAQNKESNNAYDKAFQSDDAFTKAWDNRRKELSQLRGEPQPTQPLANNAPKPAVQPPAPRSLQSRISGFFTGLPPIKKPL